MPIPTTVRINTSVPFPATVTGSGPITIVKQSGIWTVGLSFTGLGTVVPSSPQYPTDLLLIYDTVAHTFNTVTLQTIINAAMAGISADAIAATNLANHVTIVGDGVTDNANAFYSFAHTASTRTQSFPQNVTITAGNPTTINLNNHGLVDGQPVSFSGSLPVGMAGVTFYVISAGLTGNSFQISTTNPLDAFVLFTISGDGTAFVTAGSSTTSAVMTVMGLEWLSVSLPAGNYFYNTTTTPSGGLASLVGLSGNKKNVVWGYGAVVNTIWGFSPGNPLLNSFDFSIGYQGNTGLYPQSRGTQGLIFTVQAGATVVTLITLADVAKFNVGRWIMISALDMQGSNSFPPNSHYNEFRRITAINTGSGNITLDGALRNSYKSSYPTYVVGTNYVPGGDLGLQYGGASIIQQLSPLFGTATIIQGIHNTGLDQGSMGLSVKYIDCQFENQIAPSVGKLVMFERCYLAVEHEIDKLVEEVIYKDCQGAGINIQSTSIDNVVVNNCLFRDVNGTSRRTSIKDSTLDNFVIGCVYFGATENLYVENCRLPVILYQTPLFVQASQPSGIITTPGYFTFTNGTLKIANATIIATVSPISWAVPGRSVFFSDAAGRWDNMGAPFKVLDVYTDGTNTCIDTTLSSIPVGNGTTHTVTISQANPGVVTWTTHGLSANTPVVFTTTGTLPAPLFPGVVYYVIAPAANTFNVALAPSGSAIITTSAGSGVHTGFSNPVRFFPHPCSRATFRNCTGSARAIALSRAPAESPIFSYDSHYYAGDAASPSVGPPETPLVPLYAWGNLVTLTVNVVKAYTGVAGTLNVTLTNPGFNTSLVASAFSEIVNLKTSGVRTVTATATTGGVAGDTLAAYADWLSGPITVLFNVDISGEALSVCPVFEITIQTDQGITAFDVGQFVGPQLIGAGSIRASLIDGQTSYGA